MFVLSKHAGNYFLLHPIRSQHNQTFLLVANVFDTTLQLDVSRCKVVSKTSRKTNVFDLPVTN